MTETLVETAIHDMADAAREPLIAVSADTLLVQGASVIKHPLQTAMFAALCNWPFEAMNGADVRQSVIEITGKEDLPNPDRMRKLMLGLTATLNQACGVEVITVTKAGPQASAPRRFTLSEIGRRMAGLAAPEQHLPGRNFVPPPGFSLYERLIDTSVLPTPEVLKPSIKLEILDGEHIYVGKKVVRLTSDKLYVMNALLGTRGEFASSADLTKYDFNFKSSQSFTHAIWGLLEVLEQPEGREPIILCRGAGIGKEYMLNPRLLVVDRRLDEEEPELSARSAEQLVSVDVETDARPNIEAAKPSAKGRLFDSDEVTELAKSMEAGLAAHDKLGKGEYTPDEKLDLESQEEAGKRAKNRLIEGHMGLVKAIALSHKQRDPSLSLDDLVQEGALGLMRAIEKFDYRAGNELAAYAPSWIRRNILREIDRQKRSLDGHHGIEEALASLARHERDFREKHDQRPTIQDLAAGMDVTEEKIREMFRWRQQRRATSLHKPTDDEGDESDAASLANQAPGADEIALDGVLVGDIRQKLSLLLQSASDSPPALSSETLPLAITTLVLSLGLDMRELVDPIILANHEIEPHRSYTAVEIARMYGFGSDYNSQKLANAKHRLLGYLSNLYNN